MHKRTFIKLTTAAMATPVLAPLTALATGEKLTNWAGNLTYSTETLEEVSNTAQVQKRVKELDTLKVLGTRHCFNTIADSKHRFISLTQASEDITLDTGASTVTVNAGIKYGQLSPYLHERGFALPNLASLPHISVAGACATATHGSGEKNGNLASAVTALELVTADGGLIKLSREADGDRFRAAVVHLGALGVVTKITLAIQPTFLMTQHVYQNLPIAQLKDHFDEIQRSGYSVSLFTNWQKPVIEEVWIKRRADDPKNQQPATEWLGATLAKRNLHPIPELSAENCTEQMGVPGPWYERMPHFRMGFTPSSGKELQSEYFVPHRHAVEAILAISRLGGQIGPHLLTSEIRSIAADDLWLSPCYQQDSVALHFTWKQDWPAVSQLLPMIENELAPFEAKPHWGKLFTMDPATLQKKYSRLPEFRALAQQLDPRGKFRNDFLNHYIFTGS
jgi:alditol oxidase